MIKPSIDELLEKVDSKYSLVVAAGRKELENWLTALSQWKKQSLPINRLALRYVR